jgi:ferrous iron transport protein A
MRKTSMPVTQPARLPLAEIRAGEAAIIVGIDAGELSAKRLADLGFVPGVRIEMVRRGAPCIVRIDGTRIGLGKQLQRAILMVPA